MRRRGAGIGAIQKDKRAAERFKDKGNELAETNLQEMTKQVENFRQNLEEFAREHREDIKKNPAFRKHFQVNFVHSSLIFTGKDRIPPSECSLTSGATLAGSS
jgi:hypothetical protein